MKLQSAWAERGLSFQIWHFLFKHAIRVSVLGYTKRPNWVNCPIVECFAVSTMLNPALKHPTRDVWEQARIPQPSGIFLIPAKQSFLKFTDMCVNPLTKQVARSPACWSQWPRNCGFTSHNPSMKALWAQLQSVSWPGRDGVMLILKCQFKR